MNKPVYIFDADGVLNNITDYVVDERVIQQIARLLNNGHYVAINTGRGYPWVKENVINHLKKYANNNSLSQLFVSAEMGGITVEFIDGAEHDTPTAFSLLPEHIEQVKTVFDQYTSKKHIAWYEGKASMATVYKPADTDSHDFMHIAQKIADELKKIFVNDHVKVHLNPDALDVTTPEAGKWAGAQLIHDWLLRTPAANTTHFLCFGDNASDYEMARFFGQQGHRVDFVFTGKTLGTIEHDPQVTVITTKEPYSNGTVEFLQTMGVEA